jgi:hypothetical protein
MNPHQLVAPHPPPITLQKKRNNILTSTRVSWFCILSRRKSGTNDFQLLRLPFGHTQRRRRRRRGATIIILVRSSYSRTSEEYGLFWRRVRRALHIHHHRKKTFVSIMSSSTDVNDTKMMFIITALNRISRLETSIFHGCSFHGCISFSWNNMHEMKASIL